MLTKEEEKVSIKKEQVEEIIVELNIEREKANKKNDEVTREKKKIEIEKEAIEICKIAQMHPRASLRTL